MVLPAVIAAAVKLAGLEKNSPKTEIENTIRKLIIHVRISDSSVSGMLHALFLGFCNARTMRLLSYDHSTPLYLNKQKGPQVSPLFH